jgi:F0F1-type ATP synthase assembly protein I
MGLSVLLGYLLGDWLDDRFGTHPWFQMGLILVGITAGFVSLFRQAGRAMRAVEAEADPNEGVDSTTKGE